MLIYSDHNLKLPLDEKEMGKIDEVWELINIFSKPCVNFGDYRRTIIRKIRQYYNDYEFLELEKICNKLFWNLRWVLFPLFYYDNLDENEYTSIIHNNYNNLDELPISLLKVDKIQYRDNEDLKRLINKKLSEMHYYRSFINKLFYVDKSCKTLYCKSMEGSSEIFGKNSFNIVSFNIFNDRKLYEEVMRDPYSLKHKNIELPLYYHQQDYSFPNLNMCTHRLYDDTECLERIRKMFFHDDIKKDKFWFKLIL